MLDEMGWPSWWEWEIEFSPHLLKRMADRQFTEVDLRTMLAQPQRYRPDVEPGRWVLDVRHSHRPWEVIVEPDEAFQLLVVITAYPVESEPS